MIDIKHGVAVAAATVGLAFAGVTSASADPKNGEHIDLACGGTTYQVVVMGNGEWTPAHDTNSRRVFVPTSFGDFTGTVRDADGTVVDQFTEPGSTHGSGKRDAKADVINCTFSFVEVSDGSDPEFPAGSTFTGTGTVRGFVRATS